MKDYVSRINSLLRVKNHYIESFDIEPLSHNDMLEMNETNKLKVRLFDIKSGTIDKEDVLNTDIENLKKDEAYLIVAGGWIPCTFIKTNTILYADRNIISEIIRRYENGNKKLKEDFDSFDSIFLANKNIMLDISLFVIEGNQQQLPTNEMIDEQINTVLNDLKVALPNLEVAKYPTGNKHYYDLKNAVEPNIRKRMEFLQKVTPTINKQFTVKTREQAIKIVLDIAKQMQLGIDLVVILALLRVLMKDKKSAAQLLLKDSQNYTEQKAYNAVMDLFALELLFNAYNKHKESFNIAFITRDKGLSLFSSMFSTPKVTSRNEGKIQINTKIDYSIFSEDEEEIRIIQDYFDWCLK